ncbi:MAG: GNAT family N-acetyltransferase [Candidatus Borkfalkia sp.]
MGIGGETQMLFVSGIQGKGYGKALLRFGIEVCSVRELAVNEQNPQAIGFYEHMGFGHTSGRIMTNREPVPALIHEFNMKKEPRCRGSF